MKVIIVGGLAGSGKTTTILRLSKIFSDAGQRIGAIVQETGDVDYDENTLHEMGINKRDIESVCIPCSLDADIINNMQALHDEFRPDVVFIEAEETVLPVRIKVDLERMELKDMQIAPMVTIVDAAEFPLETEMLLRFARIQVEDAAVICLNKKDLADQVRISQLKQMFKGLNSNADVLELNAKEGEGISELMLSLR
ncbi:GTP-binding protein [Methanomethylovorans sp.]|uniref:GTP-binding protein n=1 Tax=Methanomethylovorans sp. TaxID=2758717 RepID=UPI00351C03A6